ncbi:hypothetical protein GCM10027073_42130 [Streptomyces chlorus]|uniref:DUF397 domain-containing protein n=1 Tax=Streptomyces chlorus TaxID=887452 RepID=A0ABW1E5W8_9ACTN
MSSADPTGPASAWFRSSYSNGAGGECVECARVEDGMLVRDSKCRGGEVLAITSSAWQVWVDSWESRAPGQRSRN